MTTDKEEPAEVTPGASTTDDVRESGRPGGGQGRIDEVGGSGVQPVSIPHTPRPDAVTRGMAEWGQGDRGAAGYEDHGESELRGILESAEHPETQHTPGEEVPAELEMKDQGEHKSEPAGLLPPGVIYKTRP